MHHVSFQDRAQVTPVHCVFLFVGQLSHPRACYSMDMYKQVKWCMNVVSTHTSANTRGWNTHLQLFSYFSLLHEFTNACIWYDVICYSNTKYISVIKCYQIENDYRLSDSVVHQNVVLMEVVSTYKPLAKHMNPIWSNFNLTLVCCGIGIRVAQLSVTYLSLEELK